MTVLEEVAPNLEPESDPTERQGYGIFAGSVEQTAVLVFDAVTARWVRGEEWHARQRLDVLPDGSIRLEVPYSHPQEIMMDILRHGPHVEVIQPSSLRSAVADAHRQAAERYSVPKRSVVSAQSHSSPRATRAR